MFPSFFLCGMFWGEKKMKDELTEHTSKLKVQTPHRSSPDAGTGSPRVIETPENIK